MDRETNKQVADPHDKDRKENLFKKCISFFIKYLLPLAFTVLLLVYLFHKVDFRSIMKMIEKGVDYWWILLAMLLSIFSHVFRAARWRLQLNALSLHPKFMSLCCSIFGCYALNLVLPRLGELWRCTYISTTTRKGSFSSVFGSMLGDRVADTVMVSFLLLLCLVVAAPALYVFLDKYPLGRDFLILLSKFWFWCAVIGVIILITVALYLLRNHPFMMRLRTIASEMWNGLVVILTMKGKWLFILLTFCIWGCYYFQLYLAFYAFDFTRQLCHQPGLGAGLIPCLVAFVLSSISMAVPSNGGLGPWNIAIMFALAIYGINDDQGTAFSMVVWGAETLMLIILGIFTMIYISLHKISKPTPYAV